MVVETRDSRVVGILSRGEMRLLLSCQALAPLDRYGLQIIDGEVCYQGSISYSENDQRGILRTFFWYITEYGSEN